MKRKSWKDKLTEHELKHVRETTDTGALYQFKENREHQRALVKAHKEKFPDFPYSEACYECRHIALKLGIEEV